MIVRCVHDPIQAQQVRLPTLLSYKDPPAQQSSNVDHEAPAGVPCSQAVQASLQAIEKSVGCCDTGAEAPVLVFISKMMPLRIGDLAPQDQLVLLNERQRLLDSSCSRCSGQEEAAPDQAHATQALSNPYSPTAPPRMTLADLRDKETFLALGRVYSGKDFSVTKTHAPAPS